MDPAALQRLLQEAEQHIQSGRLPTAWNMLERGRRKAPSEPAIISLMVAIQISNKQPAQAERMANQLVQQQPQSAQAQLTFGDALEAMGKGEEAVTAWQKAASLDSQLAAPHTRLAHYWEAKKIYMEAESAAEKALQADSRDVQATLIRARCDGIKNQPDQAVKRLLKLPFDALKPDQRVTYYFELAKQQTGSRRYQQAFDAYIEANRLQNLQAPGDSPGRLATTEIPQLVELAQQLPSLWPQAAAVAHALPMTPGLQPPIFCIGFPRAGHSLLARMLAAHPRLMVMTDHTIHQSLKRAVGAKTTLELIKGVNPQQLLTLRAHYLKEQQRLTGERPPSISLVDVHSANLVELPLLLLLFPNAQFIQLQRHPLDLALQLFIRRSEASDPATFRVGTFKEAASLYVAQMNLHTQLSQLQPMKRVVVKYESMIENMPNAMQHLLKGLGLPWNDAIRQYRTMPVRRLFSPYTIDAQVEMLHGQELNLWQGFSGSFRGLLPALDPYVRHEGYPPVSR
uniref:Uncharacterized protein n=1 Tax=Magnetococcus massalia (strain MO-1) TaxID=451514 RepID=A0A1S7LFS2_MAGMO|nr:Conserved protein of unknown function. Containing tetratricopeptide TPR_2 repeat [Candidatus Magnetococcus massalia]